MKHLLTTRLKKRLGIFFISILLLVVVIILFISPITKHLVEKYDEEITGREITMDWAYVNPFTGYVYFKNLKIHEFKNDSVFLSVNGFSANMSMAKLLAKTYEVSELTITRPKGLIIHDKKRFNFTDLIEKFSPKKAIDTTIGPLHLNILNLKIVDGEFCYQERMTPVNYTITKVNIESTGLWWDSDTVISKFSFMSDTGSGIVKGNSTINIKNKDYRFAAIVQKFDLKLIAQYLKDLSNFSNFSASLDADIKASGNFLDGENLNATGMLAINDLHLGKSKNEDYAAFDRLKINIIQLSPKNNKYLFDTIALDHPYLKYEKYDRLDNLQLMFGKEGTNIASANANPSRFNLVIEIGKYIEVLSRNFFRSNYKINQLSVSKADFRYNDFSIGEKFSVSLDPLDIHADSIDKNRKRAGLILTSGIKPYGNMKVTLSINPKDSSDFDVYYTIQKVPMSAFNPYLITMTSFPLDRGTVELNGDWHVRNGDIQSTNHLLIIDPRVSKRIRNKDTKWLPVPLLFSLIRERGNVIDYEVPITGNLKDPKFHLRDVLLDLLGNIFIKPITTPYRITVRNIETEIEKSLTLKWSMRESDLLPSQEKFIERMARFLADEPETFITIYPQYYEAKEKESILFFESKKKYFLSSRQESKSSFSKQDSIYVTKMSIKDSFFVSYLDNHTKGELLFTVQDKCARLIRPAIIDAKFNKLNADRISAFKYYFKEKNVLKQVKVYAGKDVVPYNGFTFYKIVYKGDMPPYLDHAYNQMNELNDEAPRNRFKKERNKIQH